MPEPTPPRAARLARPSWFDIRLLLGVLLIVVAVVVGARVFASADTSTRLYTAAHALVPGEHLRAGDLAVGRARLDGQSGAYISADGDPPVGYVVQRYVGSGELVPVHAVAPRSAATPDRLVALPVAPGHLPPDLGPGSLVDVYASPKSAGGGGGDPTLIASDLAVQQRTGGTSGLSGTSVLTVVVAVPIAAVNDVIHAVETGTLDLVAAP